MNTQDSTDRPSTAPSSSAGGQLCGETAAVKIFWPGKAPIAMCLEHSSKAMHVASVLGLYVHADLADPDTTCEHSREES